MPGASSVCRYSFLVTLDALLAGGGNSPQPSLHRFVVQRFLFRHLQQPSAQDVQIVNIPERVLHPLEVFFPGGILFGQKTLHRVAKMFHRDPQAMCGNLASAFAPSAFPRRYFPDTLQNQARE